MSDLEKSRARCEAHEMAYDPTLHTGCILCRREEAAEDDRPTPNKGPWPYVFAGGLVALALGGIGLGIYGHQIQTAGLDAVDSPEAPADESQDVLPEASPEAQLMLGRLGADQYGYPHDLPNKLTLLGWLRDRRYEKLTNALESLEDDADADFRKERWPTVAFAAFRIPDRRFGRRLDAWARETPDSFAPYLARAEHRVALARHLRNRVASGKGSKKRSERVHRLFAVASEDIDRALELRPGLVDASALRLMIATERDADIATRTEIVEAALEQCPDCVGPRAAFLVSITPSRGGSHELMAEKAVSWQGDSTNPKVRQLLGYVDADLCAELADQDPERALAHCERALRTGKSTDFLEANARVFVKQGRHREAIAGFDEALTMAPQHARILADRGSTLLKLERYDDAAKDLALAVRLDPTNAEAKANLHDILDKLVRAAYYQAEAGEVDDAIANYDRVLELQPRYADALANRGIAYAKKDELDRAERDLLRAIKIDPRNLEAYRGLDAVLFPQDRLDEIVAHWNRYLKRKPRDATALFKRSGAHYHKGEMELAMRDVRAACRLGNDEACVMQRRFAVAR